MMILRMIVFIVWVVFGVVGGIVWKMFFNGVFFGGLNSVMWFFGFVLV